MAQPGGARYTRGGRRLSRPPQAAPPHRRRTTDTLHCFLYIEPVTTKENSLLNGVQRATGGRRRWGCFRLNAC